MADTLRPSPTRSHRRTHHVLADVRDALTSARVYKSAMGHQEALELIVSGGGTQFDPAVVAAFQRIQHEFDAIRAAAVRPAAQTDIPPHAIAA